MNGIWLVVMGVSGCGKSSLGAALATAFALPLIEGDDHHPVSNVEKMRQGIPLTDADRAGWLATLGRALAEKPQGAVLTCSALKRAYRQSIERDEAERRVAARAGAGEHMFPASLVANQFATLESPVGEPGVVAVDATAPLPELVAQVQREMPDAARL
jgi:gluconokinase